MFHALQKPDITAIDNVSVSGAGGFPTRFPGTSAAAPHVAGIAALLQQQTPGATPAQLRDLLTANSVDLGASGRDDIFGFGRVDALAAFEAQERQLTKRQLLLLAD